jgi:hypothetical protein
MPLFSVSLSVSVLICLWLSKSFSLSTSEEATDFAKDKDSEIEKDGTNERRTTKRMVFLRCRLQSNTVPDIGREIYSA